MNHFYPVFWIYLEKYSVSSISTYGKRKLREIDRRIRYLTKQLDAAIVIDPTKRTTTNQVFFGATVTIQYQDTNKVQYSIVGVDEADPALNKISWTSPLASSLLGHRQNETIQVKTPEGKTSIKVIKVKYE